MLYSNENNIVEKQMKQRYKENYIADMLVRTLFSNDVNASECHRIIELFKSKVQQTKGSV